jgi:trimethylamine--corrinoid protein Co-methyltransferase
VTYTGHALPSFNMLTREQSERIHRASLEILRRTGIRVYHDEAIKLLRQADAIIEDGTLVYYPASLIEWALGKAPSRIPLCRRGSNEVIAPLEGRQVSFGTGSDCLTYLDPRTGERRPFLARDVIDCIHVVDAVPEMNFCMSMGIPTDLGTANPYLHQFAMMTEHTTKPIVFVCDDRRDCEDIVAMAAAAAGGIERLRMNPSLLLYSEPSTPLRQSETAVSKLLYMAEQSLPVVHSPAPVQGGTAPVTLAAALALANAEALSALVIHQLKRAGAPFVYGCGMHQLDMKTTISVYASPEFELARVAVAEMGRFYGLPTWGYAGDSNSCIADEDAATDATFSLFVALLAGNNLTHDVGYLEAGLTTSPEMIVYAGEAISMLRRFMAGINLDDDYLGLDAIHEIGPGGDYLTCDHTLRHFRELWQPKLFNRRRGDVWAEMGSKRLSQRLRDKTVAIMETHQPQPLPAAASAEITRILKTRYP